MEGTPSSLIIKECNDLSTTMIVYTSFPNSMSLCALLVFYNAGIRQKPVFVKMSLIGMGSIVPAFT